MLHNEIEETQKEIILTMGEIGESRSKETGNHVKRVAQYSYIIALGLGMSTEEAELLKLASPMHDIGKVVLSHAVPGKAQEAQNMAAERNEPVFLAERALFKTDHAAVGARLLDRWGFPKNLTAAVRHHNEPAAAKGEVRLASCVCLSNILAYHIENIAFFPQHVLYPDSRALQEFGLTQPTFEGLAPEARANFESSRKAFL